MANAPMHAPRRHDPNGRQSNETTKLNYDLHVPNPYFRLQRFHIPQDNRCIFGSSQQILRLLRHHHACYSTVVSYPNASEWMAQKHPDRYREKVTEVKLRARTKNKIVKIENNVRRVNSSSFKMMKNL